MQTWINEFNQPCRYKIAYGGRGSGKSWGIARLLLYLVSVQNAPIRVLCAREFQASIADSVHRLFADTIAEMELPGYTVGKVQITHENGAVFFFRGLARNPHSIKSAEGIDIVWVEEAHAVSEDSWRQLIPTIRKPDSEIWISYNPRYLDDPTCQRFYGDNAPENAIVCEVNHDSNTWFPDVLKTEMESDYARDPEIAEHIWGGKPLQFSNAQVLKGKWIVESFTPQAGWDGPYFGLDFGLTDPTAAVKCWMHNDVLYIEKELYASGVDNIPAFLDGIPELKQYTVKADNQAAQTIKTLQREYSRRIVPCEKWSSRDGFIFDGVKWLRGLQQIVIHPACKNTISEAGMWRWKTDNAGNVLPKLESGNDHAWDAIRYALESQIKANRYDAKPQTITGMF